MVTQKLLDFIKDQQSKGQGRDLIIESLTKAGWSKEDIDQAFGQSNNPNSSQQTNDVPSPVDPKLPGVIALYKESFQIIKQKFGPFLIVAGIPSLIISLMFLLISSFVLPKPSSPTSQPSQLDEKFFQSILILIPMMAVFIILMIIVQLISQIAIILILANRNQNYSLVEALKEAFSKIIPYLRTSFLTGIIVMGGYFLFVIPGIILAIRFMLVPYVSIAENTFGMNALLKSSEYVRKMELTLFVKMLLGGLVFVLMMIPVGIVLGIVDKLKIPVAGELLNFSFFLATPLVLTFAYLIYEKIKAIKGDVQINPDKKKKYLLIGLGGMFLGIVSGTLFATTMFLGLLGAGGALKDTNLNQNNNIFDQSQLPQIPQFEPDDLKFTDVTRIQNALESYQVANGTYPITLFALEPDYIDQVPIDVQTGNSYEYTSSEDGSSYQLCYSDSIGIQQCVFP